MLPDFSSSVLIMLTGFPHGVFLSPAQWKGLSNRLHRDTSPCRRPPRFCFMVSLPRVQPPSLCTVQISLNSAIFLYTAGPATFRPLTAALDSSHFVQGREREKNSLFFIELCNVFSSKSQLLPPRRERGSLA